MFLCEPDRTLILQALDTHSREMSKAGSSHDAIVPFYALFDKVSRVDPSAAEEIELLTKLAEECEKISDGEVGVDEELQDYIDAGYTHAEASAKLFVRTLNGEDAKAIHEELTKSIMSDATGQDVYGPTTAEHFVDALPDAFFADLRDACVERVRRSLPSDVLEKVSEFRAAMQAREDMAKSDGEKFPDITVHPDYRLNNRERRVPRYDEVPAVEGTITADVIGDANPNVA